MASRYTLPPLCLIYLLGCEADLNEIPLPASPFTTRNEASVRNDRFPLKASIHSADLRTWRNRGPAPNERNMNALPMKLRTSTRTDEPWVMKCVDVNQCANLVRLNAFLFDYKCTDTNLSIKPVNFQWRKHWSQVDIHGRKYQPGILAPPSPTSAKKEGSCPPNGSANQSAAYCSTDTNSDITWIFFIADISLVKNDLLTTSNMCCCCCGVCTVATSTEMFQPLEGSFAGSVRWEPGNYFNINSFTQSLSKWQKSFSNKYIISWTSIVKPAQTPWFR